MKKRSGEMYTHRFFCARCGMEGLPVDRFKGSLREAGHMKIIFMDLWVLFGCYKQILGKGL